MAELIIASIGTMRPSEARLSPLMELKPVRRVSCLVSLPFNSNSKPRAFSPSAIALAPVVTQAKIPMVIANAGTAWITNLSPYIARLSFSMWHHGYPMGAYAFDKIGCKSAALAYTDFPPGKDSTEAFKTGFEKVGGKVTESIPLGSPVQVPDFTPFFQRIKATSYHCRCYAFSACCSRKASLCDDFDKGGKLLELIHGVHMVNAHKPVATQW